jgi:aminoglycoside 6'-N-acetyltransferase I
MIRPAAPSDLDRLAQLLHALWPDGSVAEHAQELAIKLSGQNPSPLPLTYFVAESPDRQLIGFAEVGLRSHADGCDPAHPAGYLEGWYVDPAFRRQGIGRALLATAEDWARSQGCREMASDALIDNNLSQQVHATLGFEVVDRCVHYRKQL